VTREGQGVELKALDFDLLRFLVESAPNVVNADVLAEKVWGRHFVSPENVAQRVMLLRQSLSDDANKPRYIETVRNKGYRLIPAVETVPAQQSGAPPQRRRWLGATATLLLLLLVGLAAVAALWLGETADEPAPSPSSVAVMPFENLSPDPGDAYFAAGMQDEIVSQLTKISGLRVIPVRPADSAQASVADVVRDLNVATALGGSVYYAGGRVRVTPRLTQAATGVSLWSDSYERELSNIFAIQSEIALDVAHALRLELSDTERQRIERVPAVDSRARDLYLKARARNTRDTPEQVLRAIVEVEEALEIEPAFQEAWILDANSRNVAQFYDPARAAEHRERGKRAALRAVDLDPESGRAYDALGFALFLMKEWKESEAAFRKARRLNTLLTELPSYAVLQLAAGNAALAREILDGTRAAEPYNAVAHRFLMFANSALGEWATAAELYESGIELFEPWREGSNQQMHWLIGRDELAGARAIPASDEFNATMLARLDAPEAALAELRRAFAASGAGDPNRRRDIGLWAGHFGETALALEAMRAAIDEQGGQMVYAWMPQLAPMRKLPEFRAYMVGIGMVAYWDEYGWPPFCQRLDQHEFECE
jgi:TolB-like protein